LVFCHISARRKSPPRMWNVACDLAINSIIVKNAGKPRDAGTDAADARPLPRCALIPGQWPTKPDGRELSKEEKDASDLGALIASFPEMQASEWYFNKIMEASKKNGKKKGKGKGSGGEPGEGDPSGDPFEDEEWLDSMDDHDAWDEVSDEQREYVEGKAKAIIERAVNHADQLSTGWGSIPSELRTEIRKSVSNIINWRAVLRQFIGTLVRGSRTTSIKRINRRYPYIHPGIKHSYVAKLLIARDESGSVDDEMLALFFGELNVLTKKIEIDFLPFDCHCSDKDIVPWKKGQIPGKATKRTKGGGTDFDAPTRVFNDPKNRGRWDGLLIMTDGMAPAPTGCRGKRGWILGKNCTLAFGSTELQIFVTAEKPMSGAWR
jgi:predicted metal-dependent peptidase